MRRPIAPLLIPSSSISTGVSEDEALLRKFTTRYVMVKVASIKRPFCFFYSCRAHSVLSFHFPSIRLPFSTISDDLESDFRFIPSYDWAPLPSCDGITDISRKPLKSTMFEVVFRTTYDGFYCNISRRFPSFKQFFWCNYGKDIIEIVVDNPEEYKLALDKIVKNRPSGIIEESSDQHKIHMIVKDCTCDEENAVAKCLGSLDILHLFPTIIEKGWEYHRILFFRHEDFEELTRRLKESGSVIEILRKVPFNNFISGSLTLNADTLMSNLTEKQIDALLTAHRFGYYYLPRKADIQAIANKMQIPRTTFQEHLKKAENKLIASLIPYVQIFKHSSSEQKKRLIMIERARTGNDREITEMASS